MSQKSKKAKKKAHLTVADGLTPIKDASNPIAASTAIEDARPDPAMPLTSSPSQSPASKKEWKALKKQKAKAKKEGDDDFDRALDELSTKYATKYWLRFPFSFDNTHIRYSDIRISSSAISKGKGLSSRSLQAECYKLLSVSLSHLNPDAEMRRFFGARVISASKNEAGSSSRARRQPTTQRSNLTRPQSNWWPAKLREGLTLRPLTDDEATAKAALTPWSNNEEKYWTAEYSKRYKGATVAFMSTVLSGGVLFLVRNRSLLCLMPLSLDPEGFYDILRQVPWHADTLLQLAELYSHREGQALPLLLNLISIFLRAQPGGRLHRTRFVHV